MQQARIEITHKDRELSISFFGEFNLYHINDCESQIKKYDLRTLDKITLDFLQTNSLDTAAALFLNRLQKDLSQRNINIKWLLENKEIEETLQLIRERKIESKNLPSHKKRTFLEYIGDATCKNYRGFLDFISFLGVLFYAKFSALLSWKNLRYKEIFYEMNESAIKALLIVAITSFLIGVVVAYQSAYQLKIYGANIFIVDMLGLSILRELSPLITAIIIAGRSGSAYTAQIGAMKITEELDAMRTMGFDPYLFLVIPRIVALMIAMPILIFISDVMALFGGMIISNIYLDISSSLFIERFSNVIAAKHFFVGIVKGPFFAFLIATIAIHRGLRVQNDTQSIGINTTKSVVESIFAVIVCDAIFSVFFTNLGI
ncbi:MAG: ABC transporter permease [Helicobacteraceae bacterium]|nr:ABC transporter permease [Helicobacteraceae bacterium]